MLSEIFNHCFDLKKNNNNETRFEGKIGVNESYFIFDDKRLKIVHLFYIVVNAEDTCCSKLQSLDSDLKNIVLEIASDEKSPTYQ